MPRKQDRVRLERGLYRAGYVYFASATLLGSRKVVWKKLGAVGVMEARRLRDEFAAETRRAPAAPRSRRVTSGEVAEEWLADQDARVAAGDLARSSLDVTIGWYKAGETVFDTGTVESRTLTCESATGTVLAEHKVIIDRGERKLIGGVCTRKTK